MTPNTPDAEHLRREIGFLPTPPCTERQPDRSYPVPAALRAQLVEVIVLPERQLGVVGQRFAVAALRLALVDLRTADRCAYDAIEQFRMFRYAQVVRGGRCLGGISTHAWGTAVDVAVDDRHMAALATSLERHGFCGADTGDRCDLAHFALTRDAVTFGRHIDQIRPF